MSGGPAFGERGEAVRARTAEKGEGEAVAIYKTGIARAAPVGRQVRPRGASQAHNVLLQVDGKREEPVPLFTLLLFFFTEKDSGV